MGELKTVLKASHRICRRAGPPPRQAPAVERRSGRRGRAARDRAATRAGTIEHHDQLVQADQKTGQSDLAYQQLDLYQKLKDKNDGEGLIDDGLQCGFWSCLTYCRTRARTARRRVSAGCVRSYLRRAYSEGLRGVVPAIAPQGKQVSMATTLPVRQHCSMLARVQSGEEMPPRWTSEARTLARTSVRSRRQHRYRSPHECPFLRLPVLQLLVRLCPGVRPCAAGVGLDDLSRRFVERHRCGWLMLHPHRPAGAHRAGPLYNNQKLYPDVSCALDAMEPYSTAPKRSPPWSEAEASLGDMADAESHAGRAIGRFPHRTCDREPGDGHGSRQQRYPTGCCSPLFDSFAVAP